MSSNNQQLLKKIASDTDGTFKMAKLDNPSLDLGSMTISWLCGGNFELDGGTMYGAVPKILWNKKNPADANNYIKLLNAPLLVRTPDANIIIDTGVGNKLSDKQKEIFRVYKDWSMLEDLQRVGLSRNDIDYVILTHCDFDHAGGITMQEDDGGISLTFPKARHIIQKDEWFDVNHPSERTAHTYWPENFRGLTESSLLDLVQGEQEIVAGLKVVHTGGHTRGHQIVEMHGKTCCAVHLADLLPMHTHSNPLWIMAYDNFPMEVIEIKQKLLSHYRSKNYWFTFYHDIFMKACQFDAKGKTSLSL